MEDTPAGGSEVRWEGGVSDASLDGAGEGQVEEEDAHQVIIHLQGHTKYRAQSGFYIEKINTYLTWLIREKNLGEVEEVDAIA